MQTSAREGEEDDGIGTFSDPETGDWWTGLEGRMGTIISCRASNRRSIPPSRVFPVDPIRDHPGPMTPPPMENYLFFVRCGSLVSRADDIRDPKPTIKPHASKGGRSIHEDTSGDRLMIHSDRGWNHAR